MGKITKQVSKKPVSTKPIVTKPVSLKKPSAKQDAVKIVKKGKNIKVKPGVETKMIKPLVKSKIKSNETKPLGKAKIKGTMDKLKKLAPKKSIKKVDVAKKSVPKISTSPKASTASKTSTATKTATSTKTSTDAYTQGNITVTGGAGAGATKVNIAIPGLESKSKKTKAGQKT